MISAYEVIGTAAVAVAAMCVVAYVAVLFIADDVRRAFGDRD